MPRPWIPGDPPPGSGPVTCEVPIEQTDELLDSDELEDFTEEIDDDN